MSQGGFASGPLDGKGQRHAVFVARFNSDITEALKEGAIAAFARAGVKAEDVEIFYVPGAFEFGSTAKAIALTGRYSAVTCLGCVIQGDTDHHLYVSGEAARLIGQAAYDTGIPVIFGVLTTHTHKQALERAGATGNKGQEAADTAIEMALLLKRIRGS